jgi:hypothetical protein
MNPCGVTDPFFKQCCLEYGHKGLHNCTIPPPDEYFEEENGQIIISFDESADDC